MDKKFTQYALTVQSIRDVGDTKKGTETNFGCIAMKGKEAYCIKTNEANTISDLFHYSDYATKSKKPKQVVIKNKLNHANGLAYYNNALWVATKTPSIVKIDLADGYKRYTFTPSSNSKDISGITHYKGNEFIVKTGENTCEDGRYLEYKIITFGQKKEYSFDGTPSIKVINPKYDNDFKVPQDICYYNGNLYIILGKKESGSDYIKENVILVVDLKNRRSVKKDEKGKEVASYIEYFFPHEVLVVKKKSHTKYELESLAFDSKGSMIMAANIEGNKEHDAILKVTKKTKM